MDLADPPSSQNFDGLAAWIGRLQARLEQGEFADLPASIVGDDYVQLDDAETAIRVLLDGLQAHNDLTLEERRDPDVVAGQVLILTDLLRLRERIG
jgi:hypothetical protein